MANASQSAYVVTTDVDVFTSNRFLGCVITFANGVTAGAIQSITDARHAVVQVSQTVALQAITVQQSTLYFYGFSTLVSNKSRICCAGFSVEKSMKMSYLQFWGFSLQNLPANKRNSILYYQIN